MKKKSTATHTRTHKTVNGNRLGRYSANKTAARITNKILKMSHRKIFVRCTEESYTDKQLSAHTKTHNVIAAAMKTCSGSTSIYWLTQCVCVCSSSLNKSVSFYYHEVLFSFSISRVLCTYFFVLNNVYGLRFAGLCLRSRSLVHSHTLSPFLFFSLSQFYTENEIKTIPYPFIYCYKIEFTK